MYLCLVVVQQHGPYLLCIDDSGCGAAATQCLFACCLRSSKVHQFAPPRVFLPLVRYAMRQRLYEHQNHTFPCLHHPALPCSLRRMGRSQPAYINTSHTHSITGSLRPSHTAAAKVHFVGQGWFLAAIPLPNDACTPWGTIGTMKCNGVVSGTDQLCFITHTADL
jgi:hypothetical protein